jgi:hypothetical protein
MPTTSDKATPSEVRQYFAIDGELLPAKEIMGLKKADPEGYDQIARGIKNGTYTY